MNRTFLIFLIFFLLFLFEWYSFQAVKTLTAHFSATWKKAFHISYLSLSLIMLCAFLYYHFGNPDLLGKNARMFLLFIVFMNFIAKLFMVLFLFIDDIQRGLRWVYHRFSNPESKMAKEGISRSEFLAKTGIILAAVPLVSMSWGIVSGAHDYRVRRIKLPVKNLPRGLEGLRIGQISDIHSGSFWNKRAVIGGVEMLQAEKPDLLFFTGDLVNNRATEMQDWGTVFSKMQAPLGVYSVFGNHDYGDYVNWETQAAKQKNSKDLMKIQKGMGWDLLSNESRVLEIDGEKLGIIGVENWSNRGRFPKYGNLQKAAVNHEDNAFNILLSHDPSHWQAEVVNYPKIDLTLSGHTHGMQFGVEVPGFKWSPVQYIYKEWAGLYQSNQNYLYVNRGFGYIGYPGRIGIPPEITIITLENA